MKLKLIPLVFTCFYLSSCVNKGEVFQGKWKVVKVETTESVFTKYPPLSALDPTHVTKYNSHTKTKGRLFYLAEEEDAIIEFGTANQVNTTLFFSNYGEKIFEYYPSEDLLKIKFKGLDSLMSSTGEQIVYQGKFILETENKARWKVSENKTLVLERKN